MIAMFAGFFTLSLTSCRDQETRKSHTQEVIDDMHDKGADVKVKDDKIKMETEDEKVKIKKKDDGTIKVKHKKEE